ncbi:hypothetical protein C8R44DRAFT_642387, partial [Mycena epipterygia]
SAGAGIFFRWGSLQNLSLKVPGPGRAPADRGCIYAIHKALQKSDSDKIVVLFCSSKMLCYSVVKNMSIGWPGANSDLFKSTVKLLTLRHAQRTFVHIEKKEKNESKQEAYHLAKSALRIAIGCKRCT